MKLFADTADIKEIKEAASWGIIDGVTTNPSLIKKSGRDFKEVVLEIAELVPHGPISAEVISTDVEGMLKEAREYAAWRGNIVIKIPCTEAGIQATSILAEEGINVNVTLVFSAPQALLVAKAGASYVSPFVGRVDDISYDGMALISEIKQIYLNYDFETEIIAASIRHPRHVLDSALLGAHIATCPFGILKKLFNHPLTDIGLAKFLEDAGVKPKKK